MLRIIMRKLEHVDYEITKSCNLACVHCSAEAGKGEAPNKNIIEKVLKEASRLGLKRVGITGGEPFLFLEQLLNLVDFAFDELGCSVHIHSNGYFINENISLIQKKARKIENLTLTLLGNRRSHDANSGQDGSYEIVKTAIKSLLETPVPLALFLIPMSNNYLEFSSVIEEFYELGVRDFRIMRLSPGGRAKKKYKILELNGDESKQFVSSINSLEKRLGGEFKAGFCTRLVYPELQELKHHLSCLSGINRLHIDSDGYVFPCTAASGFMDMNVGNIHQDNLKNIWGGKKLNDFRKKLGNYCRVQQYYREKS